MAGRRAVGRRVAPQVHSRRLTSCMRTLKLLQMGTLRTAAMAPKSDPATPQMGRENWNFALRAGGLRPNAKFVGFAKMLL